MNDTQATYTSKLRLEKPGKKQRYDIEVFNSNFQKLDDALKAVEDLINTHKTNGTLDHPLKSILGGHIRDNAITGTQLEQVNKKPITESWINVDTAGRVTKVGEIDLTALVPKSGGTFTNGFTFDSLQSKTQSNGDKSTYVATTAFVANAVANLLIKNNTDVIQALKAETLKTLGVKYSLGENGYICFGELFGGLIIQWGKAFPRSTFNYPIAFQNACLFATFQVEGNPTSENIAVGDIAFRAITNTSLKTPEYLRQDYKLKMFVVGF